MCKWVCAICLVCIQWYFLSNFVFLLSNLPKRKIWKIAPNRNTFIWMLILSTFPEKKPTKKRKKIILLFGWYAWTTLIECKVISSRIYFISAFLFLSFSYSALRWNCFGFSFIGKHLAVICTISIEPNDVWKNE